MSALLTIKNAATYLTCSEALVEKMIREGRLPIVKLGRLTRIKPQDLESVMDALPTVTKVRESNRLSSGPVL
jgi:excisionase family DNA binding protein